MSKYEKLDAAILENLSPHSRVAFCVLENIPSVKAEMELVSDASPKDRWGMKVSPFRVLDRRLQALRKSGKIRATSKGWVRVTSQEPA
ncbi:hypothetical protein [Burkholderia gladioli]|uniref:hypothetical protein n=1 Tax=Burkholderia gladioli TaxID=28095 RepID=UPI0016406964|nr:hypothetical protein [Burkholderia gladioli]